MSPIILILGSGPRIGAATAKAFASQGYSVATVSRQGTNSRTAEGYLSIKGDLSDAKVLPSIFSTVKSEFKAPPNFVLWVAGVAGGWGNTSLFDLTTEAFAGSLAMNTVNAYAAAKEAYKGFEELKDGKKIFVYVGNALNEVVVPVPAYADLAAGKAASAAWVGVADTLYKDSGVRFIYADERKADGTMAAMDVSGDAHAEFLTSLAKDDTGIPWQATFIKGQGYKKV